MNFDFDKEGKLKQTVGNRVPFKVPDGYFEEVQLRIMSSLPEYPAEPVAPKLSVWHKVKPYVYLAAMFAGIWCMMKMFYMMSTSDQVSLDSPPQAVVLAMADGNTYDYYVDDADVTGEYSDYEVQEDVVEMYDNIDDFEKDFGYEFEKEYYDWDYEM